jgi:hypothetical protein
MKTITNILKTENQTPIPQLNNSNFFIMKHFTKTLAGTLTGLMLCLSSLSYGGTKSSSGCPTITITVKKQTNVSYIGGKNGSASATASGGIAPYKYSWAPVGGTNNAAANLSVGSYTITATDKNGCTGTRVVTITLLTQLSKSTVAMVSTAHFSKNTGTSPIMAMSNNLGNSFSMLTINDTTPLSANITSINNVSCYGGSNGSATVTVSGGIPPYTYLWSDGETTSTVSGLHAGRYSVSVYDSNNSSMTLGVGIDQPTVLTVSITSQTNVSCHGGSNGSAIATVSGGTQPYTYSWTVNGGTNDTATNLSAGTYTVTVNDSNGCGSVTDTVTISQPATIRHNSKVLPGAGTGDDNQMDASSSVEVYPNPIKDITSIAVYEKVDGELSIFDASGRQVYSDKITSDGNTVKQINIGNLPQGVYILKITSDGKEIVKRIIKL